jgi:hypothetical protein
MHVPELQLLLLLLVVPKLMTSHTHIAQLTQLLHSTL